MERPYVSDLELPALKRIKVDSSLVFQEINPNIDHSNDSNQIQIVDLNPNNRREQTMNNSGPPMSPDHAYYSMSYDSANLEESAEVPYFLESLLPVEDSPEHFCASGTSSDLMPRLGEEDASSSSQPSSHEDNSDSGGEDWENNYNFQKFRQQIGDPKTLLRELVPDLVHDNMNVSDEIIWKIVMDMFKPFPHHRRPRIDNFNKFDSVVDLIKKSNNIVVLSGAGISVSCGIPDFRSRDGIYSRLSKDYPDLPDPQAMFDIEYFRKEPRPFFKFAKEIYPGQFIPSVGHEFIKLLEDNNKLLRNYSQNIDTLEYIAGIKRVITCHGSFNTASCLRCKHTVPSSEIKDIIFRQDIPYCSLCKLPYEENGSIIKPDIVFFGESLSDEFHESLAKDKKEIDLLIVVGSSLKVRPVAMIPTSISHKIPQILINRERLDLDFDVELLGDSDIIISHLCAKLGESWSHLSDNSTNSYPLTEVEGITPKIKESGELPANSFLCLGTGRYLFPGAEVDIDDHPKEEIKHEVSPLPPPPKLDQSVEDAILELSKEDVKPELDNKQGLKDPEPETSSSSSPENSLSST